MQLDNPSNIELLINWIKGIKFSDFADFLSVISFGLTIYVLFTIRKIKNHYIFKARVPDLMKQLIKQASNLSQYHNDFESSRHSIMVEIGRVEVNLNSLKRKVDRSTKNSIKDGVELIKNYSSNNQNKEQLMKVYIALSKIIQEVKNIQEDRNWENNNG